LNGGITVFVQTPLDALTHTPGLGRVIIDAFVSAAIQADGVFEQRMLFLLDEAFRLGPMKSLEVARDYGRKFGITLALLYQSEALLLEQWGKEARGKWFEAVSWRSYSSIKDFETAKAISAAVGNYAVLAYSEGDNTGQSKPRGLAMGSRSRGSNVNVHEISRPLIRPEEVLHDMRSDEQIVFSGFGKPLRCGKAIFWRRPDLVARIDSNRFNRVAAE
jgi:type IV secretion system protein VirD4